jgi:hypothetical protein
MPDTAQSVILMFCEEDLQLCLAWEEEACQDRESVSMPAPSLIILPTRCLLPFSFLYNAQMPPSCFLPLLGLVPSELVF